MENPLHHFELHPVIPIHIGSLDLSINKAVIAMWIGMAVILGLFMLVAKGGVKLIPGKLQSVLEIVLEFLRGLVSTITLHMLTQDLIEHLGITQPKRKRKMAATRQTLSPVLKEAYQKSKKPKRQLPKPKARQVAAAELARKKKKKKKKRTKRDEY